MSKGIDIERIEEEIRREIVQEFSQEEILSFEPAYCDEIVSEIDCNRVFDQAYFEDVLESCRLTRNINYYKPIHGNPVYVFVKRIIRKLNLFLIKPIVEEQTNFNIAVTELCNQLKLRLDEQERAIVSLRASMESEKEHKCE